MNNKYKILVLGSSKVGKTSLINKLIEDEFNYNNQMSIDVINFKFKFLKRDYIVKLWDTIGINKLEFIQNLAFKGCMAIILLYDITNYESFKMLEKYISYLNKNSLENIPKLILGNKNDLINLKKVKFRELEKFAIENNIKFKEISVIYTPRITLIKLIALLIHKIDEYKDILENILLKNNNFLQYKYNQCCN